MKVNNATTRLRKFKDISVGATFMIDALCYIKLGDCKDEDNYHFNAYNFNHETFDDLEDDEIIVPVECELTIK